MSERVHVWAAADVSRRILSAATMAPTDVGGYILVAKLAKHELSGLAHLRGPSGRRLVNCSREQEGERRANQQACAKRIERDRQAVILLLEPPRDVRAGKPAQIAEGVDHTDH